MSLVQAMLSESRGAQRMDQNWWEKIHRLSSVTTVAGLVVLVVSTVISGVATVIAAAFATSETLTSWVWLVSFFVGTLALSATFAVGAWAWERYWRTSHPSALGAPASPPIQPIPTRHYSTADKDRISEMFYELADLLAKRAAPMEKDAQDVIFAWEHRIGPGSWPAIAEQLQKLSDTADAAQESIYASLPKKHHKYETLLAQMTDPGIPDALTEFRQEVRNFIKCIGHAQAIVSQYHGDALEVQALMNPML